MIRIAAAALPQLRLLFAQTAFALACALVFDIGNIDPDFFTLVAQILPVLLLAALFEPKRATARARRELASTMDDRSPAQSNNEQLLKLLSEAENDFHEFTASEGDPCSTSIDPTELEGLDIEEIMAKVMPRLEAARERAEQAQVLENRGQQLRMQAEQNQLKAEQELAVAEAAFDQLSSEARGALRASIWGLFVGEAAALYAVASGQHSAFLAVFCGLSVLITFWIITETWIRESINSKAGA